jgi:hypothetical protein
MDGGWVAVAIGMLLTGSATELFYLLFLARRSLTTLVPYAMVLSFVCVSVYGYMNLSMVLMWKLVIFSLVALFVVRRASRANLPGARSLSRETGGYAWQMSSTLGGTLDVGKAPL